MKVHLIHGIHANRPGGNTSKLKPFFEAKGFEVVTHNYGWIPAVFVPRFFNDRIAKRIASRMKNGDIAVGHSNGSALIHIIQEKYRQLAGAVLINPALNADAGFGFVGWVDVYYNHGDSAVPLAKLLPFHRWGDMGAVGYTGGDPRVKSIDCGDTEGMPPCDGHSALFDDARLTDWGPYIVKNVIARL